MQLHLDLRKGCPYECLGSLHSDFTVPIFHILNSPCLQLNRMQQLPVAGILGLTPDVPRSAPASQNAFVPRVSHIRIHWKRSVGPQDCCWWWEASCWTRHRSRIMTRSKTPPVRQQAGCSALQLHPSPRSPCSARPLEKVNYVGQNHQAYDGKEHEDENI